MTKFTRLIDFSPAFDKRHPDPKKNYGIHGVTMRWWLKGPKGAIGFVVYTNWHLRHVQKELTGLNCLRMTDDDYKRTPLQAMADRERLHDSMVCSPMPADIGYHSPKPIREWQKANSPSQDSCEGLDGKPCWCDGSSLNASRVFEVLIEKGSDAVWKEMEEYYASTFESADE